MVALFVALFVAFTQGFPALSNSRTVVSNRVGGAPDLPIFHPLLVRKVGRSTEQVHVTAGADASSLHITWSANGSSHAARPSTLNFTLAGSNAPWTVATCPPGEVYSTLMNPRYPKSEGGCEGGVNYTNPYCFYTSLAVHTVKLFGLAPSTKYTFRCGADTTNFTVTTLPATSASRIRFGVVGDLGQTTNSSETIKALQKAASSGRIDGVLHAGDLSYADGNGYRWDSYGNLMEGLSSLVPLAHTGGNHEISNEGENWVAYQARYPNSHLDVGSTSFLWYSFENGPTHIIMLCSYAATTPGSAQYEWLKRDLASIDRKATPWVFVMIHTPLYTSNHHHPMSEGKGLREDFEPLLLSSHVDVVFNGHVHAYERTFPVAHTKVDPTDGIPHITIGDGGNREHFAYPWEPIQPEWSALREFAYGYGFLDVNRTHAVWTWMRNDDPWNPPSPHGRLVGDVAVYKARY